MTQGSIGFFVDGVFRAITIWHDAYPEGLGRDVTKFCRDLKAEDIQILKREVRDLRLVIDGGQDDPDGSKILENIFHGRSNLEPLYDGTEFLHDSLFCEWAYILNLDEETLDIYTGFRKRPSPTNPLGTTKDENGYYPVRRVARFPILAVPANWEQKLWD